MSSMELNSGNFISKAVGHPISAIKFVISPQLRNIPVVKLSQVCCVRLILSVTNECNLKTFSQNKLVHEAQERRERGRQGESESERERICQRENP